MTAKQNEGEVTTEAVQKVKTAAFWATTYWIFPLNRWGQHPKFTPRISEFHFNGTDKGVAYEARFVQTYVYVQFCVPRVPLERATRLASGPSEGLSCCNLWLQNSEKRRSRHVAVSGPRRTLIMRQVASLKAMRLAHKRTWHQKPPRRLWFASAHMLLTTALMPQY